MIYCCGKYLKPEKIIYPDDEGKYIQQKLEIAYCPNHGKLCELTYFDKDTLEFKTMRPKRKNVEKFIERIRKSQSVFQSYKAIHNGTKAGQAFIYGRNIELKDKVRQYAVDFNGTATLVKELTLV